PAALRVRGGDHRGTGLAVGHAGGRRRAGDRADDGRQAVARLGDPRRPRGLPHRLALPPAGPVREAGESRLIRPIRPVDFRIERATRSSRAGEVGAGLVLIALVSLPAWGGPGTMRILVEFIALLVLAQMWNLLAGYA